MTSTNTMHEAIERFAKAFNDLPNDRERLSVIAGLIMVMKTRIKGEDESIDKWLDKAYWAIKACITFKK